MTAEKVFALNGDFKKSPLIKTVKKMHRLFLSNNVPYAIIGGMAVVRSGAVRTTIDVDILTTRAGWEKVRMTRPRDIHCSLDHAVDRSTSVEIDIVFSGNDWEMKMPVPDPESVREYDDTLGAFFIDLLHLIELKTAVYIKKRDEDGIEIAAKDLADIVALTQNNRPVITADFIGGFHPAVREEFGSIVKNISRGG